MLAGAPPGEGPQAPPVHGPARRLASAALGRHGEQHAGRPRDDEGALRARATAGDLTGGSREAVMDGEPWTYRVSAQEVRREGRVARSGALPAQRAHPRPAPLRLPGGVRACARTRRSRSRWAWRAEDDDRLAWYASDTGGRPRSGSPAHRPQLPERLLPGGGGASLRAPTRERSAPCACGPTRGIPARTRRRCRRVRGARGSVA